MSKEEKVDWFRRNKSCNEPGKRKAFDDAAVYEEDESKADINQDDTVVRKIPLDDFIIRQRALGKVGNGSDEEKNAIAKEAFLAIVADRNIHTPKINGQYLVPIVAGTEERVGTQDKRERRYKRQKTVNDNVDQATAEEMRETHEAYLPTYLPNLPT